MASQPTPSEDNVEVEAENEQYLRNFVRPQDMILRTADGKCLNCCDIDFDNFFDLTASPPPIPSITVAFAKIASDYCSFCKLLIDAASQLVAPRKLASWSNGGQITLYFKRLYIRGIWNDTMFRKPSSIVLHVTIKPAPWPITTSEIYFTIYPIFRNIVDDRLHSGRLVNSSCINLSIAEQWLTTCDALHGNDCTARSYLVQEQNASNFRVIDVQEMCIKPELPSCRYVALSYVWGNVPSLMLLPSNIDVLYRKGSLNTLETQMPQTIRDAIQVVQEIGERYLWVDCLCILQADEKTAQMRVMDQIFGSACLTIVAACGVNASMGLLGTRENSRSLEHLSWAISEQLTLAAALQNPNGMSNAQWASRGWTLQEALLGKRFLIFRDGQMIWQCRQGMEFEDTLAQNKAYPYQGLPQLPQKKTINITTDAVSFLPHSALLRTQEFEFYVTIVQDYTRRYLTESADILNAFGGLSKIFEVMFGARMLAGLPESYFDVALLWQPKVVLKRRDVHGRSFPSWSWAGWIGEISYAETETKDRNNQEGVVPLIRWFVSGLKTASRDHQEPLNDTGIGVNEPAFDHNKTLSTCMWYPVFEDPQISSIRMSNRRGSQTLQQIHLTFWTSAAYLSIVGRTNESDIRDQRNESKDPPLEYQIRNKFGYVLGHVTMTGLHPTQIDESRHEFIVISGAQFLGFDMISWQPKFSIEPSKWEMYNVLLIEWDERKEVAYRIGLGGVLKSAWPTGNPKRKLVVLG